MHLVERISPSAAVPREAWLPPGKSAAVCFTIDDVHPGRSTDAYEAGGDLDQGALGHVTRLQERHPELWVTLITTAHWREISPVPTRRLHARIPFVRDRVMLAPILPEGTMRLDRHPGFAAYLAGRPRTEVGLHGLYHVHAGPRIFQEFQDEDADALTAALTKATAIFRAAGISIVPGMNPPGWDASPALLEAMRRVGLRFVASARDIRTEPTPDALTAMSGMQGVSLLYPELLPGGLIHFTNNFQATSTVERATAILRAGGLLAIKGHVVKNAAGFVMADGIDAAYCGYLDEVLARLKGEFGEGLWWTSMGQVAARVDAWLAGRDGIAGRGGAA